MSEDRLAYGVFFGAVSRSVEAGGFRIDLRTATVPPEAVVEHSHDEGHFIFTLADGYHSLASREALRGGALIYNPPGTQHRDCFDETGGGFLAISTPTLPPSTGPEPTLLRSARAGWLARRLVGTCIRPLAGAALAAESLALDLAACVTAEDDRSAAAPDWLLRADEAIGDLCRTAGLEVRAIAAAAGVHPVHLARRYRRHFGQSPGAVIRQRRADAAAALLAAGVDPAQAALAAGYADQSHLTRAFAAAFAVTPARYREAFGRLALA